MSRPYQFSEEDKITSPLDRQPAKPFPTGQPPSFQTNVNRAKTKKWVEAKQYSYGGDDWGDYDEDDEYGVDNAPQPGPAAAAPAKQPTGTRSVTNPVGAAVPSQGPRRPPSFDAGDERRTFSAGYSQPPAVPRDSALQVNTGLPSTGTARALASPSTASPRSPVKTAMVGHPSDSMPAPLSPTSADGPRIIRPADIYKRMAEEREKAGIAGPGAGRASLDRAVAPPPNTVAAETAPVGAGAARPMEVNTASAESVQAQPPVIATSPRVSLPPQLPDFRGSTFVNDLWSPPESSVNPADSSSAAQQGQLGHTPSTGLRSLVNRAFDEPVTSDVGVSKQGSLRSAADSNVSGADTAGTSDISPIMGPVPTSIDKSPAVTAGGLHVTNASEPPTGPIETEVSAHDPSTQLPKSEISGLALASISQPTTAMTLPDSNDMAGREADLAAIARHIPEKALPAIATSELNAQQSFLDKQPALPSEMSPRIQRAESPTKGRVANLTNRFDSESKKGSQESLRTQDKSLPPSPTKPALLSSAPHKAPHEDITATRPVAEREASFRPKLPGQWESYAPSAASASSENIVPHHDPLSLKIDDAVTPTITRESGSDIDLTPTTKAHQLPTREIQSTPQPPGAPVSAFVALTAAGAAMGDAIKLTHSNNSDDATPRSMRLSGDVVQRPGAIGGFDSDSETNTVPPTPLPKDSLAESSHLTALEATTPKAATFDTSPQTPKQTTVPHLNVDDSPSDLESDRLRKEIVRSLSPVESPATGRNEALLNVDGSPSGNERPRSSVLPSEYESYWKEAGPAAAVTGPVAEATQVPAVSTPELEAVERGQSVAEPSGLVDRHRADPVMPPAGEMGGAVQPPTGSKYLTRRFSWEQEDDTPAVTAAHVPPPPGGNLASGLPSSAQPAADSREPALDNPRQSHEGLHVVNAEPGEIGDTPADTPAVVPVTSPLSPVTTSAPLDPSGSSELPNKSVTSSSVMRGVPGVAPDPKLPSFREIMAFKSPQQRIATFNSTRDAWATHETGLSSWIASTVQQNPEHKSLMNGQLHTVPTESFTPRHRTTTSLGNIFNKPSQDAVTPPQHSNNVPERNSPATKSSVGAQKGKELLQSAGVLGGKGISGAKGLFAKGKQRLKGAGGNDKVDD